MVALVLCCREKGSVASGVMLSHEPEPNCEVEMKREASRCLTSVSVAVASNLCRSSMSACQFSLVTIAESSRDCGGGRGLTLANMSAMAGTCLASGRPGGW